MNPDNKVMLCYLSMSQFPFPWNEDADIYLSQVIMKNKEENVCITV